MVLGYGSDLPHRRDLYTVEPPSFKLKTLMAKTNKDFNRETGEPILFSDGLARFIQTHAVKALNSKREFYDPPSFGIPKVDGEIKRFITALCAYYNPIHRSAIPEWVLIQGILDYNFVDKLKKIRLRALVETGLGDGEYDDYDPDLNDTPVYHIKDISEVFNPRYWIFWSVEDPWDEKWALCSDIEKCPVPLPLTEELKDEFVTALKECLPDVIQMVDPLEVLLQVTGSSALGSHGKSTVYIQKNIPFVNTFSRGPLQAELAYVQKCPGDTRRASVLSVPQSNSIKLIEKQLALIAGGMNNSIYVKDNEEFERRYKDFQEDCELYYCRDIRKDGLTKNRELVTLTMKTICERYPSNPIAFYGLDMFFSSWTFTRSEDPSKKFYPPRGVGLGMFSAGTTIMQCAIFQMAIKRGIREGEQGWVVPPKALFYHDDTAIGFTNQVDLDTYIDVEDSLFTDISMIKNKKKSFVGKSFVLCERYSGRLDTKLGYQLNLLYAPFAATNIVEAKALVLANLKYKTTLDLNEFIPKYVEYWRHEFVENEHELPSMFGGWVPASYRNVSTIFQWYKRDEGTEIQARFRASNIIDLEPRLPKKALKDKHPYSAPFTQIFGKGLNLPEIDKQLCVGMTMSDLHKKMAKLKFGGKAQAFTFLAKKRWMKYRESLHFNPLSETDFYLQVASLHPNIDFLPPPDIYDLVHIGDYEKTVDYNPRYLYTSVNQLLSYVSYYNPGASRFLDRVIPSPVLPGFRETRHRTAEDRRLEVRTISNLAGIHSYQAQTQITISDRYDLSGFGWRDPWNVGAAWAAHHFENKLPVGNKKHPYAEFRRSPLNLWLSVTPFRKIFEYLVHRFGFSRFNHENFWDDQFYVELLKELPDLRKDRFIDLPYDSDVEEYPPMRNLTVPMGDISKLLIDLPEVDFVFKSVSECLLDSDDEARMLEEIERDPLQLEGIQFDNLESLNDEYYESSLENSQENTSRCSSPESISTQSDESDSSGQSGYYSISPAPSGVG